MNDWCVTLYKISYVCKLNEVEILFLMIVLGIIYNCCSVSIYGNISHFLIQFKLEFNQLPKWILLLLRLWYCCCRSNWFESEVDASIFERYKGDLGPIGEETHPLLSYLSVAKQSQMT